MATRFWVGGTGNWDAATTTNWSATSGGAGGASVPTIADTVTFDANSGTAATVTVTAPASCLSLTLNKSDLTLAANSSINVAGGMTLTAGTWTPNSQAVTLSGATAPLVGAWTFYDLIRTPSSPTKTDTMVLSNDITVTHTFTVSDGATVTNRVFVSSSTVGTPRTITSASNSIANADFQDITGAGVASWNLAAITGLSGDCGGNSGITFTTPTTQHWINTLGGNWSTAANWTSRTPLPQDTVVMDCAFGASKTVTVDMPRLGASVSWTGATWTTALTWAIGTGTTLFGSLTMITGLTMSGGSGLTFGGRTSYTFDPKALTFSRSITVNGPAGTLTLAGDLTMGAANVLTLGSGASLSCVNGGSNYALNVGTVSASGSGTLTLGSATHQISATSGTLWSCSCTLAASSGTIKITDTGNSNITFAGGGKTYNNVWFARGGSTGSITLSGSNTFADFKDTGTAAHSILPTAGTTNTVNTLTVTGNGAGNEITIASAASSTSTHAWVKATPGKIACDYLNLSHSVATPTNTFYAGANSINNQATATAGSGWLFTVVPTATVKTINGITVANTKNVNGLAVGSVETWNGLVVN